MKLNIKLIKKISITQLRLHFETGTHEAIRKIVSYAKLMGCRFYLEQAWWRKVCKFSNQSNFIFDL